MRYSPKRDIPLAVRDLHRKKAPDPLSPTEIAKWVLRKRNKVIKPEAVSMWFNRHSDVRKALEKEVIALEKPKIEVSPTLFKKEVFESLYSITEWAKIIRRTPHAPTYVPTMISTLALVLQGQLPRTTDPKTGKVGIDLVKEGLWALKHPDRFDLEDALEFVDIIQAKNVGIPLERQIDITTTKSVMKSFLMSKGITVGKKIPIGKSKGFGKLARLYVPIEKCREMIKWQLGKTLHGGTCSLFMWKTGTRLTATFNTRVEQIVSYAIDTERYHQITVYDKAKRSKHREGKPWDKYIDKELMSYMAKVIGNRKEGYIFFPQVPRYKVEKSMANLNRKCLDLFVPKLSAIIKKPNHFWRHMFAQHMLRQTGWKYPVVAHLGGWTIGALEESYGQPPLPLLKEWGAQYGDTIKLEG